MHVKLEASHHFNYTAANSSINSNIENGKNIQVEEMQDVDMKLESLHRFIDIKEEISVNDFQLNQDPELQVPAKADTRRPTRKCELCNTKCFSATILKRYMRKFQNGEKSFTCSICDYKSSEKSILRPHLTTHIGKKHFECTVCDCKFPKKISLKKHLRLHAGEMSFECKTCGFQCLQEGNLIIHLQPYTSKFLCKSCKYKCIEESRLKRELMLRNNVTEPFKCTFCDYYSFENGDWRNHIRSHTSEEVFECTVCDFKSSDRICLQYHLQTHPSKKGKNKRSSDDFGVETTIEKKKRTTREDMAKRLDG